MRFVQRVEGLLGPRLRAAACSLRPSEAEVIILALLTGARAQPRTVAREESRAGHSYSDCVSHS
jgi:hypothetical protein